MVETGSKIRRLRMAKKMTQKELSNRLGVTKSAISAYENGSRLPSYDILVKMARMFKVTTDYLLGCARDPASSVSVSGLNQRQVASIQGAVETYRAFNAVRERIPWEMQQALDRFVATGHWDGQREDWEDLGSPYA